MQNGSGENRDLRQRTKRLALRVIRLCASLPNDPETVVIRKQPCRCGTSVGAQYREACRARSPAEFRSKLQSALQELDETAYWMELLVESERVSLTRMSELTQEVDELIAIFVASIKTSLEASS
jgi:four helix bundle protein